MAAGGGRELRRRRGVRGAALLASVVALVGPGAHAGTATRIDAIEFEGDAAGGIVLHLRADGPLASAALFTLADPARLVIDLPELASDLRRVDIGHPRAERARVGAHPGRLRVVIDAGAARDPFAGRTVSPARDGLRIQLGGAPPDRSHPPDALPAGAAPAPRDRALAPPAPRPRDVPARAERPPERLGEGEAGGATTPIRVLGLDLDARDDRDRVLVFLDRETGDYTVEASEPDRLLLRIPGALLHESAAPSLEPRPGGALRGVTATERWEGGAPEVHVIVEREPGVDPEVSRRGSILALEFPRAPAPADLVDVQFENEELARIVRSIGTAIGESFLFDDTLRGRITVLGGGPATPEEAFEILHAALLVAGFVAVPTPGGPWRILPIDEGGGAAPWIERAPGRGMPPITLRLPLESADAETVLSAIQPLVGPGLVAIALARSQSLVLAGPEERVRGVYQLARALDRASEERVMVRRLRHRGAEEVAAMLGEAFGRDARGEAPLEVWADERSRSLVVVAPADLLEQVRGLVSRLDRVEPGRGAVRVLRVRNADPEALAGILDALAAGATGVGDAEDVGFGLRGRAFTLAVDSPTRSLVVQADPETHDLVREVVEELDRLPPLIGVELIVLEVETSGRVDLGFDAFVPIRTPKEPGDLAATALLDPTGGGLQAQPDETTTLLGRFTREPLLIPLVDENGEPTQMLPVPRESAVLTANEREVRTRVLLRPHLLVVAGEEHVLSVGDNIPVPVSSGGDVADALSVSRTIERRDVGIEMRLRPTAGQRGGVRLDLEVDVSAIAASEAGPVEEVGPTIRQRRIEATAHLEDGELAVIGMLLQPRRSRVESSIPFLGRIPILGQLARATSARETRTRLVVAVQAHLYRGPDDVLVDTVRRRLAFERERARVGDLSGEAGSAPYAVRVATRTRRDDADALARRVEGVGRVARVTRWESGPTPYYDVYATGFATLAEAGRAVRELSGEGFLRPELVVLAAPAGDVAAAPPRPGVR